MSDEEINAAVVLLRNAGWTVEAPGDEKFGCHCDLAAMDDGFQPDGCVIDEGHPGDCIYARDITHKEQCRYWRRITQQSLIEARRGE